jgi:predicted amidophosphoribosyltransferase
MACPQPHGDGPSPAQFPVRPVGFPSCDRCAYRSLNRPDVCLDCAVPWSPAHAARVCPVCEQAVGPDRSCANDWCSRGDRWFSVVWTIGSHSSSLRRAISAYKYQGERGWAEVLARLLVGYLDDNMPWFDGYDVLTSVPVYTGPGAHRSWDHLALILEAASRLAGCRWPFESELVCKRAETTPMAGLGLGRRRTCAEGPLRRSLVVPDSSRVARRRILVIDDVFTEGSTLREVARSLLLSGAVEVAGLALARQPWTGARRISVSDAPM